MADDDFPPVDPATVESVSIRFLRGYDASADQNVGLLDLQALLEGARQSGQRQVCRAVYNQFHSGTHIATDGRCLFCDTPEGDPLWHQPDCIWHRGWVAESDAYLGQE